MGDWWSVHTHSRFSTLDGMPDVGALVAKVAKMRQPAMALTDHGNMAGTTQLYTAAQKYGITPFPGVEMYLIDPRFVGSLDESKNIQRYHIGLLALTDPGYRALVKYVSRSHTRPRFNRFPRLTIDDFAELSSEEREGIAVTTGCYFGAAQQFLVHESKRQSRNYIETLAHLFPHTYVELQNHGIVHDQDGEEDPLTDDDIVDAMVSMANRIGLPVLAGQDSHYLNPSDKEAHALMKRMVYGGVEDEFPGDSFHLASERWVQAHYEPDVWEQVLEGHRDLLSLNNLSLAPLDKYVPRVPTIEKKPDAELRALVMDALDAYEPAQGRKAKAYQRRVEEELDVIAKLGQANYLLLWVIVVNWCKSESVCIEARGSGNGSLVNFLLGITQVDPIEWGTVFERFLSIDRIKPPDIDMDIEDVNRGRLIAFLRKQFDVTQIGTFGKLGVTANMEGEEKGSVVVTYKSYLARECEREYEEWRSNEQKKNGTRNKPRDPGWEKQVAIDKKAVYEAVQTMEDVKQFFEDDYDALVKLSKMEVFKSYGVHAGGILLSGDDLHIADYIPTMLVASSETTVSQFDMDDVEQWGLLKLDILGQRTLTVMRRCQELIGREDPTDFTWIPKDDSAACKILREGRVDNGVFHFEGYTKAKGGKEMGIKSTRDAVLATALYMPGAMQTGQTDMYIKRRRNPELRNLVDYPHPIFEEVLSPTYGAVVYQEQVLSIMRKLGIDIATINVLFKIVKDSGSGAVERNAKRLADIRSEFDRVCKKNKVADVDHSWEWLTGIVSYAFNGAHAAGYGIRSYRCAYLKAHYPLEYMTALLGANAGTKKEDIYVREARRMQIDLLPPDVNVSGHTWTLDSRIGAIRRGLLSIKGVGEAAARAIAEEAPFKSVSDLCSRISARGVSGRKDYLADGSYSGTILALKEAGALRNIMK